LFGATGADLQFTPPSCGFVIPIKLREQNGCKPFFTEYAWAEL